MTIKSLANPSLIISTRQAIYNTALLPLFGLTCLTLITTLDINQSLFSQFNSISQLTGESLWAILTLFGDPVVLLCLALSIHCIAPQISFTVLPTLIIGGSAVFYFKWLFAVIRPPGVLENIIVIGQPPVSGAFPSGHTAGAFALATLLILLTSRRHIKFMIFGLALLIGLSRIAVGAHWPLDISAGILVGWISAILGIKIANNWRKTQNKSIIINVILMISSFYLFFKNTGYTQAYIAQFVIAISCMAIALISLYSLYKGKT